MSSSNGFPPPEPKSFKTKSNASFPESQQSLSLRDRNSNNSRRRVRRWIVTTTTALLGCSAMIWTVRQQQLGLSTFASTVSSIASSSSLQSNHSSIWSVGRFTTIVEMRRNVEADEASINFPRPHVTNQTVIILVMSARTNFENRSAIRQTWASGHDNVYFLVAAPCPYAPSQRSNNTMACEPHENAIINYQDSISEDDIQEYTKRMEQEQEQLRQEQANFHDLIYLDHVKESYRGLPHKLKEAFHWVLHHFDNPNNNPTTSPTSSKNQGVRWLVKVDDDTVVRVTTLEHMLARYNAELPMIIGKIEHKSPVLREGKHTEHASYQRELYPYWPRGSCGYVVSRPIAQYIAQHKDDLFHGYQGEDTSLGIWMDESPLRNQTTWIDTPHFVFHGACADPRLIIIGHEIDPTMMKECYQQHGDEVEQSRAWQDKRAHFNKDVKFVPQITQETP